MKDFKNFFLSYYNNDLMKKSVDDSKCYFYNFLGKDSNDSNELQRLTELEKQITDKEELKLIREKKINLSINLKRNYHIFSETISEIESIKCNHLVVYQVLWLKDIMKYYPSQEKYILEDYGNFIYMIIKNINSITNSNIADLIDRILDFADEYKNVILFAIDSLGDTECRLLKIPKINHALQVGIETYLNGGIKNDGVATAILSDVLQYAPNNEYIREQISNNSCDYNGKKVLDIFDKTGQNPNLQNYTWKYRKYAQLNILRTPGISSFSGSIILAISKKITLHEIGEYFFKEFDKNKEDIKLKKEKFWKDYSNISEDQAKDYYSKIFNILCRQGNINDTIIEDYENNYYSVFEEYPI